MAKTKMASEKILMKSMTETGKPYRTPEQLSNAIHERVRQEKEDTTELRSELTKKIAYEMPRACPEAVNGVVTGLIQKKLHDAELSDDPELTLKPDCSKTLTILREVQRSHNGKFQVNKFDPKGRKAWSCCQSTEETGEGCCVKNIDKKRWKVQSYNEQ